MGRDPKIFRGQALLVPGTGPDHDRARAHLFVALTDPDQEGDVLLVSVASKHTGCDQSCLLGKGDHPFFKHDSFVDYKRANIWNANDIESRIRDGDILIKGPFDQKVLSLICFHFLESIHVKPRLKKYYQNKG